MARARIAWWFAPLAVALLCAGAAGAAYLTRYAESTLQVRAAAPPITFSEGDQSADRLYVTAFSLSANRSTFAASLRGVPNAKVTVPELCELTNRLAEPQTVTITAPRAASASITTLKLDFLNGGTVLSTLDLRAASPSATFSLAGGQVASVRATIGLADGAGNHDVDADLALTVSVPG